ncbi:GGDEF domain-containing protein [Mycobacterium sp. MYCO198283]|uniref:GGDEF domain-containing protein n=1 Tax=Mycobacterium sp. MYCO198283 TaxID=2883505 RepID=UPI001E4E2CF8|nr:GGDEF domain-containing protein [Mycobacterium sp. MYCO198283]MCG5432152.1 GGDEF domain-containing protein [Mycobacterium sp. MYCO198283]
MTVGWRTGDPATADHYYWLTSYLAARDLQTRVSRAVAVSVFALGLIPLLLAATPLGPQSTGARLLAAAIALGCTAMAAVWLRPSWPRRAVSQLCVALGAAATCVACLINAYPVLGLVGAGTFAMLSAFATLFHSSRMVAVVWVALVVTLAALARPLAEIHVALAACAILLAAMINFFVTFACRLAVRMLTAEVEHADLEPLTGLLTRDAFTNRVAALIGARTRGDDRTLVIAVLTVDGFSLHTAMTGAAGADRARVAVARCLREVVRRDAIIAHVGDAEYFLAELFDNPDPTPLGERIRGAVAAAPFRFTASIGLVTTPLRQLEGQPPFEVLEELLTIATTAMYDARRGGGDQFHLRLSPPLTSLDEDPSDR